MLIEISFESWLSVNRKYPKPMTSSRTSETIAQRYHGRLLDWLPPKAIIAIGPPIAAMIPITAAVRVDEKVPSLNAISSIDIFGYPYSSDVNKGGKTGDHSDIRSKPLRLQTR